MSVSTAFAQQDFGDVTFANSGPPTVQADFIRGVAQLHNFEYEDAAVNFKKVQKVASDFALAYWGEAMTQSHPVWHEEDPAAAKEILNRLAPTPEARLAKARTEREKLYLSSVEILFGDGPKEDRYRRYESAMAELHRRFPDDVDASAFYALAILGTAQQGRDFATYMRAAAVLEEVFPQHPRHPGVVHYLIHCYDDSVHAPLGLRPARIYSKIAPDAGHAQHMTSHIFLSLGMWDDVVKANENAVAVVNRKRQEIGKPSSWCGHYNEWLEYGYLQQGRIEDARRILEGCRKTAEALATAPPSDKAPSSGMTMGGMTPGMISVGSYSEMRAHFLIDSQLWRDEAAQWKLPAGDFPLARLTFDYTNAIVALGRNDLAVAHDAVSLADSDKTQVAAWFEQHRAMDDPQMRESLNIAVDELHILVRFAEGNHGEAVTELKSLVDRERKLPLDFGPPAIEKPTDELLGELLLRLHRPAEAKAAFQAALSRTPGRKLVVGALANVDKEIAAGTNKHSADGSAFEH
jgi:tetratricopeptide (TPR) repeat protein